MRCTNCQKFAFSLDSNGLCKKCVAFYLNQAQAIADSINADLTVSDTIYKPLAERLAAVSSAIRKYDNFAKEKAYTVAKTHYESEMLKLESNIKSLESELQSLQRQAEIKSYNKVRTAPNDYVVFDLETTGLNPNIDKIIEIGAIKYIDGVEKERYHSYVNPDCHIPKKASDINHIYDKMVKKSPQIREVLPTFIDFVGNLTLIAHNSDFDMSFIQINAHYKLGKKLDNDVIDTLALAREYLSNLPNKKLETIKEYFKITVDSHNAIDDCIVTAHLYQYCREKEILKFKYGIRSSSTEELSEIEVKYLNKVVEICELNNIKKSELCMYKSTKFFEIYTAESGKVFVQLKLYGKLQYILLDVPLETFDAECKTKIKHTTGSANEGNKTRLFIDNPDQLYKFSKYFIKK